MLIDLTDKTWSEAEEIIMEMLTESHLEQAMPEINQNRNMGDIKGEIMAIMPISPEARMFHQLSKISTVELNQPKIFMASIMEFNLHQEVIIRKSLAIKQIRFRLTNTARIYQMLRLTLLAKVLPEIEMDTFYQVPFKTAEDLISHLQIEADMVKSRKGLTVWHQVIPSSQQLQAIALLSEEVLL